MPDLHLAVGTLQDSLRKEEHEGCRLLDALEHALLSQIVGAVIIPHLHSKAEQVKATGRAQANEQEMRMRERQHSINRARRLAYPEAHALKLQVYGICLVTTCSL